MSNNTNIDDLFREGLSNSPGMAPKADWGAFEQQLNTTLPASGSASAGSSAAGSAGLAFKTKALLSILGVAVVGATVGVVYGPELGSNENSHYQPRSEQATTVYQDAPELSPEVESTVAFAAEVSSGSEPAAGEETVVASTAIAQQASTSDVVANDGPMNPVPMREANGLSTTDPNAKPVEGKDVEGVTDSNKRNGSGVIPVNDTGF